MTTAPSAFVDTIPPGSQICRENEAHILFFRVSFLKSSRQSLLIFKTLSIMSNCAARTTVLNARTNVLDTVKCPKSSPYWQSFQVRLPTLHIDGNCHFAYMLGPARIFHQSRISTHIESTTMRQWLFRGFALVCCVILIRRKIGISYHPYHPRTASSQVWILYPVKSNLHQACLKSTLDKLHSEPVPKTPASAVLMVPSPGVQYFFAYSITHIPCRCNNCLYNHHIHTVV